MKKSKVLVTTDYYFPGVNGGGATRTLANLIAKLGNEFDFHVVTRDGDLGSNTSYTTIKHDQWNTCGLAEVWYLSARQQGFLAFRRFIRACQFDVLYCNSFFSATFTIKPLLYRRLGLIQRTPAIVAPRGELSPAALHVKSKRKKVYLFLAKMIGLYKEVLWQASSTKEAAEILECFGRSAPVILAPDLASKISIHYEATLQKEPGKIKIVFLSRLVPIKNLELALNILHDCKEEIFFDIYGPLEDEEYWRQCQGVIETLPNNIVVQYKGVVPGAQVIETISSYHLFFLPTKSENFGNVILEAFMAGVPVLVSDQTPWRELEARGIGWDVPLQATTRFKEIIQQFIEMGDSDYQQMRQRVRRFGRACCDDEENVMANRKLFLQAR